MSKISIYEVIPIPKLADKLVGTSVGGELEDVTYNFTLGELLNLFNENNPATTLQSVLNNNNTAIQDINLTGNINTTSINVSSVATLYDSVFTNKAYVSGELYDGLNSKGTNGQVLRSTGLGVEWYTIPIIIPTLQQVLSSGNTSDIDIVLSSNLEVLDVNANTATFNDSVSLNGTLIDRNSSSGVSNQILISTQTGVEWVNLPVYTAVSPLSINSATRVISIQKASNTQDGYLASVDWINFDAKQSSGNYITQLTGEASAVGPGSSTITLSTGAVTAKALTGLNIQGGPITSSDNILSAFGKLQSQVNLSTTGISYQGVWNASTNDPILTSSVGVNGFYYIVNVAGNTDLNGVTDWEVGDWAIFSNTTWFKIDNTDAVHSVNGQTGVVVLDTDDISEGTTNLYYLDSRARLALSGTSPLLYNSSTGIFSIQQSNTNQNGYLSSTDWNTFNQKQNTLLLTTLGASGASTLISDVLNVPTYTLNGLGGVPQTRILSINGISYDLSADRSWTIAPMVYPSAGIAISTGTAWGTSLVDDSLNWNTSYDNMIVSAAVTGTSTKTLTLNQQDGGSLTADWSDIDTGLTSVGISMSSAFSVANSPLTSNGTISITGAGTSLQYIRGDGVLATFPILTGYVPYTGATANVDLGIYSLTAESLIKSGGISSEFLKADGSVDSSAYIILGSLSASNPLSYNNITGAFSITQSGTASDGYLSSTDWNTFNDKQSAGSYVPTSRLLSVNGTQYDLSADRSWSVGTVTSVAALTLGTAGVDLSSTLANGTTTPVITLNVPTASATNRGALSAADWTTFNDKQQAGNYITSLIGEATATGPGASSVTLNNASVTAKVLTGVNITGGTVDAADTMLTAFGKLQNQINGLIGGSIYKGTWNASTNTPSLASGVGTLGWYYIVNVAGTTSLDGISDWFIGDWAIFDGTAWQQVDNTDAVVSVNGQTGAVSLITDNISEGATNLYYLDSRARASLSFTAGSGAYNSTTGVITIPTNTSQLSNGANFITLASLSGTAPITYNSGTGAIGITQSSTLSNGYLSSTDWSTFNNKQNTITLTTTGTSGPSTLSGNILNIPQYPTGTVTGTGTATTLTKWSTGGTGIEDSIVTDDGTTLTVSGAATFSGALSGTSATFSGELSTTSGLFSISGSGATPPTSGVGLRFVSNRLLVYGGSSDITFQKNDNSGPNLTILESGAATFSSSVTIGTGVKIDANGDLYQPFTGQIQVSGVAGNTTYPSYGFYGDTGIGMYRESADTLAFVTSGVKALTIASTGAATFSGSVNINGGLNPDLDVNGAVIVRGNSSAYTTHYLTTAAANVAKYDMYDASGNIKNSFSAGGTNYITGGNVGIGTASPSQQLHLYSGDGGGSASDSRTKLLIENNGEAYLGFNVPATSFTGIRLQFAGTTKALFECWDQAAQTPQIRIGSVDSRLVSLQTDNIPRLTVLGTSGNVGIGTSSPAYKFETLGTSVITAAFGRSDYAAGSNVMLIAMNGYRDVYKQAIGVVRTGSYDRGDIIFCLNGSVNSTVVSASDEKMRITSGGNVLIGTTTDEGFKLDVNGTGKFSNTGNALRIASTSTESSVQLYITNNNNGDVYTGVSASDGTSPFTGTTAYSGYIGTNVNVPFQIASNGTVRLTIASTGAATFSNSVKVGTSTTITPISGADDLVIDKNGQASGISIISTIQGSVLFGDAADSDVGGITYSHSGNIIRLFSNATNVFEGAPTYVVLGKQTNINSTATGTTPSLLINSTGNYTSIALRQSNVTKWLIGNVTSISDSLEFYSGTTAKLTISSGGAATFNSSVSASNYVAGVQGLSVSNFGFISQTLSGQMTILGHNLTASNSVNNQVDVVNSGWISSMIKMYYDQGITFHTSSTVYTAGDVYPMSTTERVRITNGGNVGIGTDSPGALKLNVYKAARNDDYIGRFYTNTGRGLSIGYDGISNNTSYGFVMSTALVNGYHIGAWDSNNNGAFFIYNNGNMENQNNSYGQYSDIKLKENVVDASPKLDDLLKVKVKNFNFIGSELKQIGVIAQELEEVFPGLVEDKPDTKRDEVTNKITELETTTKSVKYSVFTPMLIKAIQEQQAIIEDLKARIEILEG